MKPKIDFRSTAGIMLRGKNVYMGGASAPNTAGRNQYSKGAKLYLKNKKKGLTK